MGEPLRLDLETTTIKQLEEYVSTKLEAFYGFKPTRDVINQLNSLFHLGYLDNQHEDFYLAMSTYEEVLHREKRGRSRENCFVEGVGCYPSLQLSSK